LDEIVPHGSVCLNSSFLFPGPFFFVMLFFFPCSHFYHGPFFVSRLFVWVTNPWTSIFFLETPTYSSNLTTPFHHPTHIPPPTYPTTHLCSPPSLELQNHREFDEKLVELGIWNIKRSLHFQGKCFFLASKTRTTSYSLLSWVFLIVTTSKTKTMSYVHRPGSFFMLQPLKPPQWTWHSSSCVFFYCLA
jgi:hypothetical protein